MADEQITVNSDSLQNTVHLELSTGTVVIKLRPDLSPNHAKQIRKLLLAGFYDGLPFHRVIDGFMAQTGCPIGNGTGGCGYQLAAEFTDTPHVRGTCSMARSQEPDSASSQFFICFEESAFLNNQYTVWGEVISGMEFVDQIKRGDPNNNGVVEDPDKIISMNLLHSTPIQIVR